MRLLNGQFHVFIGLYADCNISPHSAHCMAFDRAEVLVDSVFFGFYYKIIGLNQLLIFCAK